MAIDEGVSRVPLIHGPVFGDLLPKRRFFRWSGAPPTAVLAGQGGDVHGVTGDGVGETTGYGFPAVPYWPFVVEAGGAFGVGAALASDTQGRAKLAGPGEVVVAVALEGSAGPGSLVWAYFTSGR